MNAVSVCDFPGTVTAATATSLTFAMPAIQLRELNDKYNTYTPRVLKGAVTGTDTVSSVKYIFDDNPTTIFGPWLCFGQIDLGPNTQAVVTKVRFHPVTGDYATFERSTFRGSNDTLQWELLYQAPTITGIVEGWNFADLAAGAFPASVSMSTQSSYRYLRWDAGPSGLSAQCRGTEVEFVGLVFAVNEGASCPIVTTVTTLKEGATSSVSATLAAAVQISANITPAITNLSPWYGTALGGDLVSFEGAGLGPGVSSVTLNGMPCSVLAGAPYANASRAACVSGFRKDIEPVAVKVLVGGGAGLALVNDSTTVYFSYLDKWSTTSTWLLDEPPGDGDSVIVPRGQAVLVDVPSPKLFLVLVQGEMVFDASQPELTFDANYIFSLGGTIQAGTEAQPYINNLTITLHGDRDSVEIPGAGAKCLAVMNSMPALDAAVVPQTTDAGLQALAAEVDAFFAVTGTEPFDPYVLYGLTETTMDPLSMLLSMSEAPDYGKYVPPNDRGVIDLHGKPRKRTWTFGNQSVPVSGSVLVLSEDVDWAVGERLVVSSTDNNGSHVDLCTVAAVNGPRNLTCAKPFVYAHDCFLFEGAQYGHSDTLICWEAGLLSRNLRVQGDENSTAIQFGMHSIAAMGATMRSQNVEWQRCGQSLVVGRYCMHFHLLSVASNSYAKANSFHDSFQRAVTLHASHYLEISNNVAFHVMAHSFFIEDGVELNNLIEGNLVIDQLTSPGPIKSDSSAACFWTASNTNHWRNNVCAGSMGTGWWAQPPGRPSGPSLTDRISPKKGILGSFYNNTFHSTPFAISLWLPIEDIMCSASPTQRMENTTSWRNGMTFFADGMSHHVQMFGLKTLESGVSGSQVAYFNNCEEDGYYDRPNILGCLFVATMDPVKNPVAAYSTVGLALPQSEVFFADQLTFVNYGSAPGVAGISQCVNHGCSCNWESNHTTQLHSDGVNPNGYTMRVRGLKFFNTATRIWFDRTVSTK
jgi:hypothetical protein